MSKCFTSLSNIEPLIDGESDITIGQVSLFSCTATASNQYQALAILMRRDDETLEQLLARLEAAINKAIEKEIFIDGINNGPD